MKIAPRSIIMLRVLLQSVKTSENVKQDGPLRFRVLRLCNDVCSIFCSLSSRLAISRLATAADHSRRVQVPQVLLSRELVAVDVGQ